MKKIIVLGSNGMLGYAVSQYFSRKKYDVLKLTRNEYDIAKDPLSKLIEYVKKSDIVINCAGVIKSVIQDTPIEDILLVNSIFPRNLAKICTEYDVKCFHITTDCVYSGKKGNYTEDDLFDAGDVYGISKNAGDINDCMTLRTSIIGEEPLGNRRSLLEWAISQEGKSVNGYLNHYWNGVTTVYLAEIIEIIINQELYNENIFHIFSPEIVNKYELMNIINEVYNLNLAITSYETDVPINRSLDSVYTLSNDIVNKSIRTQINEMKKFFYNDNH